MSVEKRIGPVPIYTSRGDWAALMVFPYIFNTFGEWIGSITPDRQVYDVNGLYVGWMTDDPRILRKRTYDQNPSPQSPPSPQDRIRPPATVPLPPMMAELPFEFFDVLDEEPERLHTVDTGEFKEDMD